MLPETSLARTVDDPDAPISLRYEALKQLKNPPLEVLRRLLVRSKNRNKPPNKLIALASIKYAVEMKRKNARREMKKLKRIGGNALGI